MKRATAKSPPTGPSTSASSEPHRAAPPGREPPAVPPGPEYLVSPPKVSQRGWGPEVGEDLDPGDLLSFTKGAESYAVVGYGTYEVGAVRVEVRVRAGESVDEVFARGMRLAHTMFEASSMVAEKQFRERHAALAKA